VVVDDDEAIRVGLTRELGREGFAVTAARGGLEALALIEAAPPDAVVLDVGLPDVDGQQVCRRLREAGHGVPVLILSARSEVTERVAGLGAGADDYLVKPFAVEEVVARLRALLRRVGPGALPTTPTMVVGDLRVDVDRRLVHRAGRPVTLTRREFELLEVLVRNAGVVLSRQRLLELVWGYDWGADPNVVDVFVSYLRRKLEAGDLPRMLHTVRGVGFVVRP
jgi:two-component system response regulator PrrA